MAKEDLQVVSGACELLRAARQRRTLRGKLSDSTPARLQADRFCAMYCARHRVALLLPSCLGLLVLKQCARRLEIDFWLGKRGNEMMKSYLAVLGLLAILTSVGCEESLVDKKADAVRDNTQQAAGNIRTDANQAADNVRAADGKTITGAAETKTGEKVADSIEDAGEAKADAVEAVGERKADQLEKSDN